MPHRANPIITSHGYVPTTVLARALGKTVATMHRMIQDGRFEGIRDGRQLYVKLSSVQHYYKDNPPMLEIVEELAEDICGLQLTI
jgi:hypothetical protein